MRPNRSCSAGADDGRSRGDGRGRTGALERRSSRSHRPDRMPRRPRRGQPDRATGDGIGEAGDAGAHDADAPRPGEMSSACSESTIKMPSPMPCWPPSRSPMMAPRMAAGAAPCRAANVLGRAARAAPCQLRQPPAAGGADHVEGRRVGRAQPEDHPDQGGEEHQQAGEHGLRLGRPAGRTTRIGPMAMIGTQ